MMKYSAVLITLMMSLHMAHAQQGHRINWIQETPQAAWQPRDSQGEFVYDGNLWIMGGWFTPQLPNPRDVWKSPDGKNWTRVVETAPWKHSDLPASMVFKGKMWMMGGRKLSGRKCKAQIR